ncbi:hypothetical protein L6452_21829 [Arctium lappa]|uniref:Uncharacterized protein n=1 Tax=Arctium lappa TaxID=4217 RepID=A0ACB9AX92_ARCLA|nr:hypothetical protein L6452_21829 [Arctium lappa]
MKRKDPRRRKIYRLGEYDRPMKLMRRYNSCKGDAHNTCAKNFAIDEGLWIEATQIHNRSKEQSNPFVSKVNSLWSMEQCRQEKSAKWIRNLGKMIGSEGWTRGFQS